MRRNLIFGGTGFIGANLAEILGSNAEEEVYIFDNFSIGDNYLWMEKKFEVYHADILDLDTVKNVISEVQPHRIFHFAANSDIRRAAEDPKSDIKNTLGTTVSIAKALADLPVADLIFASSSAVYGQHETKINEESKCLPISSYGWMKLASEEILSEAFRSNHINRLFIARFPNVTGRWQTHGVVYDLVSRIKQNPQKLQILGNGEQRKPYVLASELCNNIINILSENWKGELTLNLGPETSTSVSEIASIIVKEYGSKTELEFGKSHEGWKGDIPKYELDSSEAQKIFKNFKFSDSNLAITQAVRFALNGNCPLQ